MRFSVTPHGFQAPPRRKTSRMRRRRFQQRFATDIPGTIRPNQDARLTLSSLPGETGLVIILVGRWLAVEVTVPLAGVRLP
jgi:hypothetical protein